MESQRLVHPSKNGCALDFETVRSPLSDPLASSNTMMVRPNSFAKAVHHQSLGSSGQNRRGQRNISSISQAQLIDEVKGIYAGLVMVEKKCVEIVTQQSQSTKRLEDQQWKALVALHRTLLQEHHDFFSASQHPTASEPLKKLAVKYAMPARLWRRGIHAFLELLRHRLPGSMEHMLSFIYLSYSMMALLKESVPSFVETWIECLGDLARYRMAIEDSDPRDREIWSNVARMWYNKAADNPPNPGRIQHHLAGLARSSVVQQILSYFKSPISWRPPAKAWQAVKFCCTRTEETPVFLCRVRAGKTTSSDLATQGMTTDDRNRLSNSQPGTTTNEVEQMTKNSQQPQPPSLNSTGNRRPYRADLSLYSKKNLFLVCLSRSIDNTHASPIVRVLPDTNTPSDSHIAASLVAWLLLFVVASIVPYLGRRISPSPDNKFVTSITSTSSAIAVGIATEAALPNVIIGGIAGLSLGADWWLALETKVEASLWHLLRYITVFALAFSLLQTSFANGSNGGTGHTEPAPSFLTSSIPLLSAFISVGINGLVNEWISDLAALVNWALEQFGYQRRTSTVIVSA